MAFFIDFRHSYCSSSTSLVCVQYESRLVPYAPLPYILHLRAQTPTPKSRRPVPSRPVPSRPPFSRPAPRSPWPLLVACCPLPLLPPSPPSPLSAPLRRWFPPPNPSHTAAHPRWRTIQAPHCPALPRTALPCPALPCTAANRRKPPQQPSVPRQIRYASASDTRRAKKGKQGAKNRPPIPIPIPIPIQIL